MDIRPLRSEKDHLWALKEIENLWEEAEPGTAEGDRFEVLSVLIDDYERRHFPISIAEKSDKEEVISSGFGKIPVISFELDDEEEDTLVSQRNPEIQPISSKKSTENVQEIKKKINPFDFVLSNGVYLVLFCLGMITFIILMR